MDLMEVIKALSDETRMRILNLVRYGDLCVCEIEVLLGINQSNASRHLNKLSSAKVVDNYKRAQYVFYKLSAEAVREYPFIEEIIESGAVKLKQCSIDYERLRKYKDSGLSCDDLKDGKVCFDN